MPYGDSECKTFFSQWLPPAIFTGAFIMFGAVGFVIRNARGDAVGALLSLLISAAISLLLSLVFSWRVRFEPNFAVIWYCVIFPSRIDYAEVSGMRRLYGDAKRPGVPTVIEFQLRDGEEKRWNLNLFSAAVIEEIVRELESRIRVSGPPDAPGSDGGEMTTEEELQEVTVWTENTCRPHRAELITLGVTGGLMLVLVIWNVCSQLVWDQRVRTWDKADGILLKNTTKRVRSGKSTRTVADVAYEYTYKGMRYTGTRIVYNSDTFPKLKPGTHRQVIVNPEDPRDCAIMFWYRGNAWLIRYTNSMFFGLIFLIVSGISVSLLGRKIPAVPESLKQYLGTFSPEQLQAALKREHPGTPVIGVEVNRPMEYREDLRYGIIRERKSKFSCFVFAAVLLAEVALAIAFPVLWIGAAITGAVIILLFFPGMTVFDFQERKICRCRLFRPEKFDSMRSVSFSEIDHLSVSDSTLSRSRRSGRFIGVTAVKHDGTKVPICGASCRNLGLLLELLPDLAEKMGHLPILFY